MRAKDWRICGRGLTTIDMAKKFAHQTALNPPLRLEWNVNMTFESIGEYTKSARMPKLACYPNFRNVGPGKLRAVLVVAFEQCTGLRE